MHTIADSCLLISSATCDRVWHTHLHLPANHTTHCRMPACASNHLRTFPIVQLENCHLTNRLWALIALKATNPQGGPLPDLCRLIKFLLLWNWSRLLQWKPAVEGIINQLSILHNKRHNCNIVHIATCVLLLHWKSSFRGHTNSFQVTFNISLHPQHSINLPA